ncbi:MAG: endopeptidase La [Candidatus Caldatribacteriaceae bacterium]
MVEIGENWLSLLGELSVEQGTLGTEEMIYQEHSKDKEFPEELPILPLEDNVLFPEIAMPLLVQGEKWVRLIDEVVLGNKMVGTMTLRKPDIQEPSEEDFYEIGVIGRVSRMLKLPEESVQILLFGLAAFRIKEWVRWEPYPVAKVEVLPEEVVRSDEVEALVRNILSLFQKVVELAPYLPKETFVAAMNIKKPSRLAHFVVSNLNLETEKKQEILASLELLEKLKKVNFYLFRELEILQIGDKIQTQIQKELAKTQREYFLREQLKAIQRELGELDERNSEINELRSKIEKLDLPAEVREEAEKELDRLSRIPVASFEYPVIRNYLDWIIELPWHRGTEDVLDIEHAKRILDEDHYDLEKVKERILEHLAVCQLKKDLRGPILCFVGPPGVGKTSLGKSIARSLGRNFVRMSLGGIRDEAEIRGHRRTYVGAMPGRIIQGIRKAKSKNPVFMLDEIDKLGLDFRGDPAAALLEVLDPEQNVSFVDHYLGVPFDLSRVLFIATANVIDTIPPPLLDRMEIITISGYTDQDKIIIARQYLLPKQCKENGIRPEEMIIDDAVILKIIREYTRESGIRSLERNIAALCRKVAKKIASGDKGPVIIDEKVLQEFLGSRRFYEEMAFGKDRVGVATGLAWTETGGEILFVETVVLPGKGNLILTGNMGEIMQESARIALSCIRERAQNWNISPDFHEKVDIHIHVPAGAIPKDGPSAGITIATSIASALSKIGVRHDVAMTGEITLTGRVLPVGGIKEKVLAAYRAGIYRVILPKENQKDLEEIPKEIREKIEVYLVEKLDEVLKITLSKKEKSKRKVSQISH